MNAIMKLTTLTLGTLAIAGGAALAQTTLKPADAKTNPDTANYSISPGSNLKRDASLSSTPKPAAATDAAATDSSTSTTTTTTSTTSNNPAPASPAPVAAAPATDMSTTSTQPTLQPRTDRN